MESAMVKPFKNNVTRLLDNRKIRYQLFLYDYDAGIHSAVEVAVAIGLPPAGLQDAGRSLAMNRAANRCW
jgi:prolyl-tRNA editing enzyme YbaK/EbsC (Cys-tRNA(Pro) deacylase)